MGFFDGFIDTMRLNADYDDEYDYEDEYEEEEEEVRVKKPSFFSKRQRNTSYQNHEEEAYEEEPQYTKSYNSRYSEEPVYSKPKAKPQPVNNKSNAKLVQFNTAKGTQVFVIKPVDDSECRMIIDFLKEGKTIVINLDGMGIGEAQHIIDIVVGACYTLEGDIKRISSSIFIAVPNNTEISGDIISGALDENSISMDLSTNF